MIRQDIITNINNNRLDAKIKVDEICKWINGTEYYRDMDPDFLETIEALTGTANGIYMTDKEIVMVIDATQGNDGRPLASFSVAFDKVHGDYIGVENILFKSESLNIDDTSVFNDAAVELVTTQAKTQLAGFARRASESILFEYAICLYIN